MAELITHLNFKLKRLEQDLKTLEIKDNKLLQDIQHREFVIETTKEDLIVTKELRSQVNQEVRLKEKEIKDIQIKIDKYAPISGQIDIFGNVIANIVEG